MRFLKILSTSLFTFTRINALKSTFEAYNVGWDVKQDDNDIELIYVNLKINEQESLFAKASVYLSLCLYRNQIINYFLSLGLAAVCLVASGDAGRFVKKDSVFKYYSFLTSIFTREFLFHPAEIGKTFQTTLVYFKIIHLPIQYEFLSKLLFLYEVVLF